MNRIYLTKITKRFFSLFFLILFILPFQNCDTYQGFSSSDVEFEIIDDLNGICPYGIKQDGTCIHPHPEEETQSCEVANGVGLQVKIETGEWGPCVIQSCELGYERINNTCSFKVIKEFCPISNGRGERINSGFGFGECLPTLCDSGFGIRNKFCLPSVVKKSCSILNGTGEQTDSGSGFSPCQVKTCNSGYEEIDNKCVFKSISRACTIANGTGTQTNSGSGFGPCRPKTCNVGYHIENNTCIFTQISRACTIAHGTGLQTNNGAGFGSCLAQSCNAGYRLENNMCEFISIKRVCTIANGTGEQVNSGLGFSPCRVKTCNTGYERDVNTCQFVIISRACTVQNGRGTQINSGTGFGRCNINTCNNGFVELANECVHEERECSILNGVGFKKFENGIWSECKIKSCTTSYVANTSVGFCVKRNAPRANVHLYVLRKNDGTGNEYWNKPYTEDMMNKMTSFLKGEIVFVLEKYENVRNSTAYEERTQGNLTGHEINGQRIATLTNFTKITAVVSNPNTNDAAGKAFNLRYTFEPIFALRSRDKNGTPQDIHNTAKIFLHELGHNMGMEHDYGGPVNMDNRYVHNPEIYVDYVNRLNSCTNESCQKFFYKFTNPFPSDN